jgi:DNA-binding transcriptional MocR family regulator
LSGCGELILCEELCYPGIISLAHGLQRRLRGVAMDEQGIVPAALREICLQEKPALLVCVASCQNPTTAIMSPGRRAEIAAIAEEFDFLILDDDIYGFLVDDPAIKPLAAYAPQRTVYLTSLSKAVMPALRTGYLYSPPRLLSRLTSMVRSSVWMPSPLTAQLASNVITSGLGSRLVAIQREEGVQVLSGSQFQAERNGETRGVRVVLMSPTSRDELRFALTRLASLISTPDPRRFY